MYASSSSWSDAPTVTSSLLDDDRVYLRMIQQDGGADTTFIMSMDEARKIADAILKATTEWEDQACVECGTRESLTGWWRDSDTGRRVCDSPACLAFHPLLSNEPTEEVTA